jgi:MoxR-like ATPase
MITDKVDDYLNNATSPSIRLIADTAQRIMDEVHRFIVGKDDLIETLFICLLAEINLLVEGNPGIAKTTISKTFAHTLGCTFNRQQFTPDIMPSDVIGTYVYNQKTQEFILRKGGIFSNIVMVDEINRATPRTQSALLECMEERNVTIEGTTLPLERPFMVIATQTYVDFEGTYPLPEVQIDRFGVKMYVGYPTPDEELEILRVKNVPDGNVQQVTNKVELLSMIDAVKEVYVDKKVARYIRDIIVATRNHKDVLLPSSPRGSIVLLHLSKALAAVRGREYVIPDDVKQLASRVLNHRIILTPEAEMADMTSEKVIGDILKTVSVIEVSP